MTITYRLDIIIVSIGDEILHLDLKYTNLLSNKFERFARKSDYLFNVRCPICGDSQVKKTKMRGYIYRVKQSLAYKCHNCNASMGFGSLLKQMDPNLHREWTLEVLKEKKPGLFKLREIIKRRTFEQTGEIRFDKVDQVSYVNAERVSDLPDNHMCTEYVRARCIPKEYWNKLYFTPSFKSFLDEIHPNHGKELQDDCRLVIPYYDAYGAVIAVTGRDLVGRHDALRYITLRTTSDTYKLVYGLDRVKQSNPVIIVEGPLDSLFLKNAVASGDSNLIQVAERLSAADITLVFDNEPRNKEIVKQMDHAIRLNYKVCVWPDWVKEKDVNDMILAGRSADEIQQIIHSYTFKGLSAMTHLTFWKKV